MGEVNIQIIDQLIEWMRYKPTQGGDELLNLLILELFDETTIQQEAEQESSDPQASKLPQSFAYKRLPGSVDVPISTSQQSISAKSAISTHSNQPLVRSRQVSRTTSVESTAIIVGAKPTIVDTYYDLLKSFHLQITLKSIKISFVNLNSITNLETIKSAEASKEALVLILPQVDIRSTGTKCDLEEELVTSKLVQLPCTYLRACEKTTDKLPWLIDLRGFELYTQSMPSSTVTVLLAPVDLNSLFTLKPKYHHYDNLLNSLSIVYNVDIASKVLISVKRSKLELIISYLGITQTALNEFKYCLDLDEFKAKRPSNNMNGSHEEPRRVGFGTDWDENKSYSSVSILREYDLNGFDYEENEDVENEEEDEVDEADQSYAAYRYKRDRLDSKYSTEDNNAIDEYSVSTGELSSSSSVSLSSTGAAGRRIRRQKPRPRSHTGVYNQQQQHQPHLQSHRLRTYSKDEHQPNSPSIMVMRERKHDEQVKLNFSSQLTLAGTLSICMIDDNQSRQVKLSMHKLYSLVETNNVFQKCIIRLRRIEILNESINEAGQSGIESLIVCTEPNTLNKHIFLNDKSNKQSENFLELTFTRALVSDLNKKLETYNGDARSSDLPSRSKIKRANMNRPRSIGATTSMHQKWISELNMNISNLDIILHTSKLILLINFYNEATSFSRKYFKHMNNQHSDKINQNSNIYLIPLVKPSDMPLMNIEMSRVRLLMPQFENPNESLVLVGQATDIILTSRVENPIARNFVNNLASYSLYNRAKSTGLLYRPGFSFEDRQYTLNINSLASFIVEANHFKPQNHPPNEQLYLPLLDCFDSKAVLGLPIVFNRHLINGYTLEVSSSKPRQTLYLTNSAINMFTSLINENLQKLEEIEKIDSLEANINILETSIKSQHPISKENSQGNLRIMPLDILITGQSIDICFAYKTEATYSFSLSHFTPLFMLNLIQPHICLFMHETMQKFDLSIFDLNAMRCDIRAKSISSKNKATFSSSFESFNLPNRNEFDIPVIETKPGEPHPKTGILPGFLSIRANNVANLFCYANFSVLEREENITSAYVPLVCVCSNCSRCYEINTTPNYNLRHNYCNHDKSLNIDIQIERPLRLKINLAFYELLNAFINGLTFETTNANDKKKLENDSNLKEKSKNSTSTKSIVQFFLDCNARLLTSQLIFILELPNRADTQACRSIMASLSSMSANFTRVDRDIKKNRSVNALIRASNKNSIRQQSPCNELVNLKINDIQCKLQHSTNGGYSHFVGPVTIKCALDYSAVANELHSTIDLGSFNITLNPQLLSLLIDAFEQINNMTSESNESSKLTSVLNHREKQVDRINYDEQLEKAVIRRDDELRNGSFRYTIIDDNWIRSSRTKNHTSSPSVSEISSTSARFAHIRLPNESEIVCVDDLSMLMTNAENVSHVCWRYSTRRALVLVKIAPLPFVGIGEPISQQVKTEQAVTNGLKCFLEYYNECSKKFMTLKEFFIIEGLASIVVERERIESAGELRRLVFSRMWRIRLSTEAARYIYASSLLASTRVDSLELNQSLGAKNLRHIHADLRLGNVELKLNTVDKLRAANASADLIIVNMSELSTRLIYDEYYGKEGNDLNSVLVLNELCLDSRSVLSVDYCEYRFLTVRPLIDSFKFQLELSLSNQNESNEKSNARLNIQSDSLNILISQSALMTLARLQNEWLSVSDESMSNSSCWQPPHYYVIYNDTNTTLNVKQYDTDETCQIQSGHLIEYTWRTHKKPQLMQLFSPMYRLFSSPFKLNEDCMQEVKIEIGSPSTSTQQRLFVSYLISAQKVKSNALSKSGAYKEMKKKICIQSKLLVCNYLNVPIESVQLNYMLSSSVGSGGGEERELVVREPHNASISRMSRSTFSYELVESISNLTSQPPIKINSLRVNGKHFFVKAKQTSYSSVYEMLRSGLICSDGEANINYWLSLHEQLFYSGRVNTVPFVQYNIVLAPLLLFCSYLPYNLSVEFMRKPNDNAVSSTNLKHARSLLKFNSSSCVIKSNHLLDSELSIRFDHALNVNKDKEDELSPSVDYLDSYEDAKSHWSEIDAEPLIENKFNVAACISDSNKRLMHSDLFKYYPHASESLHAAELTSKVSSNGESASLASNGFNNFTLRITNSESNQLASELISASVEPKQLELTIARQALISSSKFSIERKRCWPFARTIRVDIKPTTLLLNKTAYKLKVTEQRTLMDENKNRTISTVEANGGQLCLSEANASSKYKFSVVLPEYTTIVSTEQTQSGKLEINKTFVEYESNWIEIKDEPASPFYRERQTAYMNCLYSNKCWIDLKLMPRNQQNIDGHQSNLKLIYLVIQSTDWSPSSRLDEYELDVSSIDDKSIATEAVNFSTRLFIVRTKFLIANRTKFDLKFQLSDESVISSTTNPSLYLSPREHIVYAESFYSCGEILNSRSNILNQEDDEFLSQTIDNEDYDRLIRQSLSDIYCMNVIGMHGTVSNNKVISSKPIVLAVREKALRQVASSGTSTPVEENSLVGRQSFCVYVQDGRGKCLKSYALICAQRLLINKSGRLIVALEPDEHYLSIIYNHLDHDLYIWPRISTNHIYETYFRACYTQSDPYKTELLKLVNAAHSNKANKRPTKTTKGINKINKANSSISNNDFYDMSPLFMHKVPGKSCLKFNYDLCGCAHFPIENLQEQVFFMFAVPQSDQIGQSKLFRMSPSLCRMYDESFEIIFEDNNVKSKLYYFAPPSSLTINEEESYRLRPVRLITELNRSMFIAKYKLAESFNYLSHLVDSKQLKMNMNFSIQHLTLALNDDEHLSQTRQIELLRLSGEFVNLKMKKANANDLYINFNCEHLQLDNQMYALSNQEKEVYDTENAHKYDFPVIFMPREYRTQEASRAEPGAKEQNKTKPSNKFIELKLRLMRHFELVESIENEAGEIELHANKQDEQPISMRLSSIDLLVQPFDIYLEDSLIYSLLRLSVEFLGYISFDSEINDQLQNVKRNATNAMLGQKEAHYYNLICRDELSGLTRPALAITKMHIGRIDAAVSLQSSTKIFIATYGMPILFDEFNLVGMPLLIVTMPQLLKQLTSHYVTSLVLRAGWMLGSLDLIGSPTAFVQQLSNGIVDFVRMPYRGLREHGPSGFLVGFSSGSLSLIRNLSAGTITSLTSFASFLSRNMDILSMDPYHSCKIT
jgi:hypothetical protein